MIGLALYIALHGTMCIDTWVQPVTCPHLSNLAHSAPASLMQPGLFQIWVLPVVQMISLTADIALHGFGCWALACYNLPNASRQVKHLQAKNNGPKSVPTWNAMDMTARCTSRALKEKSRPWQNARNLARAQKSARVYLTSRADGAPTGARLAKSRGLTRRWLCRSSLPLSRTLSQLVRKMGGRACRPKCTNT